MIPFRKTVSNRAILCVAMVLWAGICFGTAPLFANPIEDETLKRLDHIRAEKKQQLFDYMEKIQKNADAVKTDAAMMEFFHLKSRYYDLQKKSPPPERVVREIDQLKRKIREHYIRNYISFYDILFVNPSGDIFYTIRQQGDYHQNLFQGTLKKSSLAKQLRENPETSFVDYQFFDVSGEPSAFIVVPVAKEEALAGWVVFQCAINKINWIFSTENGLGETGEAFLVNRNRYMLTDSRFYGDSSILKKHLSSQNIMAKFNEKSGHKRVVDYRGFRTLTSFEVCHVAGSEWLLIAKIDEDEIITDYYRNHRRELRALLLDQLSTQPLKDCGPVVPDGKTIGVDMDEWRKGTPEETILTHGVSTCTAVILSFTGKFAYLAHISNLDTLYGGTTTDLIGNIVKRIKTFDIYKYERRYVNAVIVAPHARTLMNAMDRLVDEGFFLSQIRFMVNLQAEYATPIHICKTGQTVAGWLLERKSGKTIYQSSESVQTASDLLKPVIFKNGPS
jgi:hypothetical protein